MLASTAVATGGSSLPLPVTDDAAVHHKGHSPDGSGVYLILVLGAYAELGEATLNCSYESLPLTNSLSG